MKNQRVLLVVAADGRIGKQGERIVAFAEPMGNRIIPGAVVEFVMVFVVGGRPGKGRKTVKQGDPIIRDVVKDG